MTGPGLEVTLRHGRERAEVTRFTHTLDEIVRSLREIDEVYIDHAPRPTWTLNGLRHRGNNLIVRLSAREAPRRNMDDILVPVHALVDGARELQHEPTVPQFFQTKTVLRIADLSTPHEGLRSVSLTPYNGRRGSRVDLTDAVQANATAAVRPHQSSYGSVTGRITAIGEVRKRGILKLAIRGESPQRFIEAEAPESMEHEARELWRHRVLVGGEIKRNSRGQIIRLVVDRIEPMPEDNNGRPSTAALLGAAPVDWLDGLSVDEYVSRMRID